MRFGRLSVASQPLHRKASRQLVMVRHRMSMPLVTEASETSKQEESDSTDSDPNQPGLQIIPPTKAHGAEMWRLARSSGTLDENSSYAYLLFSRDFAQTSRIALVDGDPVGFVMGYLRPDAPERYFVWQIAVDERVRGRSIGGRLLDEAIASLPGVTVCETTITKDNLPSRYLFESFARRHSATVTSSPLFQAADFPDDHDTEYLYVIDGIGA